MTYQQAMDKAMARRTGFMGRDQAYAALTDLHRWITQTYIVKTDVFRIALVVGQTDYVLDTTVKRVRTCNYVFALNSTAILKAGSTKDWDVQKGDWRLRPNQIPREFAVEEGKLIIDCPAPTVSTGAGVNMYPRLETTNSTVPPLVLTDTIPWDIPESVYITGIIYHWALHHNKEEIQGTVVRGKSSLPILPSLWEMEKRHLNSVLPKAAHNYRPQVEPEVYGVDVI